MVIYWEGLQISCEGIMNINKIPMVNAAVYTACDVTIQSKGLKVDTHEHYKYRRFKKSIILIIKPYHSIRAFLKNRFSVRK